MAFMCSATNNIHLFISNHPALIFSPNSTNSLRVPSLISLRNRRTIAAVFTLHLGTFSRKNPVNKMLSSRSQAIELSGVVSGEMIFEPILEEGVFRFDCSEDHKAAAFPSISFADGRRRETSITSSAVPVFVPHFECINDQQIMILEFPEGTSFYGTGEVSGPLERTGTRVFTWNTDSWGYGPQTTSLYQSHPWVMVIFPNGDALGVLADTTRRCEIDLRKDSIIRFTSSSPYPVVTFGPFSSPAAVLKSLCHAIGTVFMPPKWSLGYHQCRWSYDSDERVREIARHCRGKCIPCDVIWLDIDYMDGFRCFTFDKERFSDPNSMVQYLHSVGMKAIWMLDPGIKQEDDYFVYESGSINDVWIKKDDGTPFVGEVWPGPCVFPDFTQAKTRSWWANLVRDFQCNGVDGIWNDMNEPAVFKTLTKTMPESNIHDGDDDLGGCQNHSHYHNVYGLLMARSTYEGMKMGDKSKRPFVLTRAAFIGSQRYAATWTGDNLSTWQHFQMSIAMVLQLGLSGQPLSGPDIGGFAGNATPQLFGRWMGVASLFPFCRAHSEKKTADHEPWSFGQECEEVCRLALRRRYRLIPYIYTLFYMAHTQGNPVTAPLFFTDTKDPQLRKVDCSFLLGNILVDSSLITKHGGNILEPDRLKGCWMRFDFEDSHPDLPTLYLKGGSIIPFGHPYQHLGEVRMSDDLNLFIALDNNGRAEGVMYEDDGDGYQFLTGEYLLTFYSAELQSSCLTVSVAKEEGSWRRPKRNLHVHVLLGGGAMIRSSGLDGDHMRIPMPEEEEKQSLIAGAENRYRSRLENARKIPEDESSETKKFELSRAPIVLKSDDWVLLIVPWVGGRIISMEHVSSGMQLLHSRVEIGGYEEYSSSEYRSSGCSEDYEVLHNTGDEFISMEGDIGGGLVMMRDITLERESKRVDIHSAILARNVGAGSGGYSRIVCLRVNPKFAILHPTDTFVTFTSIDGAKHEILPELGNLEYEGNSLPNGEWMLVDKCLGLTLVNRFKVDEVRKCTISWEPMAVHMGLLSEERSVSISSPLTVSHSYEVSKILF